MATPIFEPTSITFLPILKSLKKTKPPKKKKSKPPNVIFLNQLQQLPMAPMSYTLSTGIFNILERLHLVPNPKITYWRSRSAPEHAIYMPIELPDGIVLSLDRFVKMPFRIEYQPKVQVHQKVFLAAYVRDFYADIPLTGVQRKMVTRLRQEARASGINILSHSGDTMRFKVQIVALKPHHHLTAAKVSDGGDGQRYVLFSSQFTDDLRKVCNMANDTWTTPSRTIVVNVDNYTILPFKKHIRIFVTIAKFYHVPL